MRPFVDTVFVASKKFACFFFFFCHRHEDDYFCAQQILKCKIMFQFEKFSQIANRCHYICNAIAIGCSGLLTWRSVATFSLAPSRLWCKELHTICNLIVTHTLRCGTENNWIKSFNCLFHAND